MQIHTLLQKPVITEKSMQDAANSKFTFLVAKDADKDMIKGAIEKTYNVKVKSIKTTVTKGKSMRIGKKRNEISLSPFKKAVIELEKGQKIDLFDLNS